MKDRYRIGEVEKLLGIPRSTIRFYIQKGYLHIDKDESNGYRYYSRKDLREIMHLVVGRSNLHLNLDESHQRVSASSLDDFRQLFFNQEEMLTQRIREDRRSLEVLSIYYRMLSKIQRSENKFTVIHPGEITVFPEEYIFSAHTTIIDAGFATAIFTGDSDSLRLSGIHSLVFEGDRYLVSDNDLAKQTETISPQTYLNIVIKSDKEIEDPEALYPVLKRAAEEGYKTNPPYFICNLFKLEEPEKRQYYYDIYLSVHNSF
ncbi:MAG: MerR family transcriptional regulator [Firmicutes bacterium]|nr:MerR family transcriptional regulator [Bacillota bacterium]